VITKKSPNKKIKENRSKLKPPDEYQENHGSIKKRIMKAERDY
jgi:hypothetical protein